MYCFFSYNLFQKDNQDDHQSTWTFVICRLLETDTNWLLNYFYDFELDQCVQNIKLFAFGKSRGITTEWKCEVHSKIELDLPFMMSDPCVKLLNNLFKGNSSIEQHPNVRRMKGWVYYFTLFIKFPSPSKKKIMSD